MKPLKWLFWIALFLGVLLAVDQFFVQVPPLHPAHGAVSRFYQDFRARLFGMTFGEAPDVKPADKAQGTPSAAKSPQSIEALIDQQKAKTTTDQVRQKPQRYVYSDANGELQFADALEDIPQQFRAQAQPMGE